MVAGSASVLVEGVAPANDQLYDVALEDRLVKSVQVPGQMWFAEVNSATGSGDKALIQQLPPSLML